MIQRSFRVFATKEDLYFAFSQFQNTISVYYAPTYSDVGTIQIDDITKVKSFGVNHNGSHIGNNQFLVFHEGKKCIWEQYQCKIDVGVITRHSSFYDEDEECIVIDLGGIYEDINLFPTTISTMHYDIESSKELYNAIRKVFRKLSVRTINGYFICSDAYEKRSEYRFCTIDIRSPKEYDLIVE
ncbi:hypothetical protein [Tissierella praeacuta]|uniref:hypothetical protein n=1 Tax=Tissierella praeacuta TaxID=43131 RepID=UPI00334094DA